MDLLIKTIGGGILSKFMVGVQSVNNDTTINNIKNVRMEIDWSRVDEERQQKTTENPFDWVFDQKNFKPTNTIASTIKPLHAEFLNEKDFDIKFSNYKNLVHKFKINSSVIERINPVIDEDTLGVHVRLTDMNITHKEYGVLTTDSFKRKIDEVLKESGKSKVFVASDNVGSIEKLAKHFDIITNSVNNISSDEQGLNYNKFLRDNSGNKFLWQDTFLDVMSLSRCGELIHTTSNMAIASVMFSNTITKKHRI